MSISISLFCKKKEIRFSLLKINVVKKCITLTIALHFLTHLPNGEHMFILKKAEAYLRLDYFIPLGFAYCVV